MLCKRILAALLAALLILSASAMAEPGTVQNSEDAIRAWAERVTGCKADTAETRKVDPFDYGFVAYLTPYRLDVGYGDGLLHRFVYFKQGAYVEGADKLNPVSFDAMFALAGSLLEDMRQNYPSYELSRSNAMKDSAVSAEGMFKALIMIVPEDPSAAYSMDYNLLTEKGSIIHFDGSK